ncbi:hypothetical protein BT69DRAFT_1283823 [Atractiella rhizophila]|nr:hypothetical protein BT69DRAFT_1283823 [Atractiella rhizophila]
MVAAQISQCLDSFALPVQPVSDERETANTQTARLTTIGISAASVHIGRSMVLRDTTRNPTVDATFPIRSDTHLQLIRKKHLGSEVEADRAFDSWLSALDIYRGGRSQVRNDCDDSGYGIQCDGILTFQDESKSILEFRSTAAFNHYAPRIINLARGEDNQGTALRISNCLESDERSIIFKVRVSLTERLTSSQPVPPSSSSA